jgi:hypothetical protein
MLKKIPGAKGAIQEARLLSYDTGKYPFAKTIHAIMQCNQLNKLHVFEYMKLKDSASKSRVFSFNYNMELREKLKKMDDNTAFYQLYHKWVKEIFSPLFENKISYNSHPSFRVHMAGTPSISAWHTDFEVTGRKDQITVWVPFTDAFDTNTIWMESDYGKGDYAPVHVKYGEALLFDGNCLSHGSVSNATELSRLSFDFRFKPKPEILQQFFNRCKSI